MPEIELTLIEATDDRKLIVQLDSEILVKDLATFIASKLGVAQALGHCVSIYEPHRGVLIPEKTLSQNSIPTKTSLRYHYAQSHVREVPIEEEIILDDDLEIKIDSRSNSPLASTRDEIVIVPSISIESFSKQLASGATIEVIEGDITRQEYDAIVNAANSALERGGGVDGAIHRAAGSRLALACTALSSCPTGSAVLTPGYNLGTKWIIHAVGPVYKDGQQGEAQFLAGAYDASLKIGTMSQFRSLAFPSIATGVYGYPIREAAHIALTTVLKHLRINIYPKMVRFVMWSTTDYKVYEETLRRLSNE